MGTRRLDQAQAKDAGRVHKRPPTHQMIYWSVHITTRNSWPCISAAAENEKMLNARPAPTNHEMPPAAISHAARA